MQTKNKTLSILLALTLALWTAPVSAYGVDGSGQDGWASQNAQGNNQAAAQDDAARAAAEAAAAQQRAAEEAAARAAEEAAAQQAAIDAAAAAAAQQQAEQQQALDAAAAQQYANNEAWTSVDTATSQDVWVEEEAVVGAVEDVAEEVAAEPSYPATSFTFDLAGGTLIVDAPEGALPEGASAQFRAIEGEEAGTLVALLPASAQGQESRDATLVAPVVFEISYTVENNGVAAYIAPAIPVNLTLKDYDSQLSLACIYEFINSESICIAGPVEAGELLLGTSQASQFAFAQTVSKSEDEKATNNEDAKSAAAKDKNKKKTAKSSKAKKNQKAHEAIDKAISIYSQVKGLVGEAVDEETAKGQINIERVFPATNLSGIAGVEVKVEAPKGALPKGAQLSVSAAETPADVLDAAGVEAADTVSIDVHFSMPNDPATEIEPYAPVNVTFSSIPLEAVTVEVYHSLDAGGAEFVGEIAGQGGTLALDQFSVYTFVGTPGSENTAEGTNYTVSDLEIRPSATGTAEVALMPNLGGDTFNSSEWNFIKNPDNDGYVAIGTTDAITSIQPLKPSVSTGDLVTYNKPRELDAPEQFTFPIKISIYSELVYDANGGSGAPEPAYYDGSNTVTVDNGANLSLAGHAFCGWSTDPNATYADVEYEGGEDITSVLADVSNGWSTTLYAVWDPEPGSNEITITKVWEDDNNRDGIRPDELVVTIGRAESPSDSPETVGTVTLTAENDWTKTTFVDDQGHPFYRHAPGSHNLYYYSATETATEGYNDGYAALPDEVWDQTAMTISYTFTNTHTPATRDVYVSKKWQGDSSPYAYRSPVTVNLLADGEPTGDTITLTDAVLDADDNWAGVFEDVPKYRIDETTGKGGVEIEYTVEEETVPYYRNDGVTGDMNSRFYLTNTKYPETTTVTIKKVWEDNDNADGTRPDVAHVLLMNDGQVVRETRMRTADGWTKTFTGVPSYDAEGNFIEYSVEEDNNAGYTVTVTKEGDPIDGYTFTVTNTKDGSEPESEVIDSIPVTKVWDDANNQDGIRPTDPIYLLLYKINGPDLVYTGIQKELSTPSGSSTASTTIDSSDTAPIYKYENGEEIEYVIVESMSPSGDPVQPDGYTVDVTGDAATGFTVTNTHEPETVEIKVTKEWVGDNNNADKNRPEALYAVVMADGARVSEHALNEANGWSTTITGDQLYKYKPGEEGVEIQYEVVESWESGSTVSEDPLGLYTSEVTGDIENGFVFTNTYDPDLVDINVDKVWMDEDSASTTGGNDRDGKRPEEITYTLLANGEEVASATVTEAEEWKYTFADMPIYNNGATIAYTVSEEYIDEYYMSLSDPTYEVVDDGNVQLSYTVTNTYDPEKTTITAIKQWDDANNQDGKRPESITVALKADGEAAKDAAGNPITAELNAANGWAHYFEGMWRNTNDGTGSKPIKYTVEETGYTMADGTTGEGVPKGYTVSYADHANQGYITITNKHNPVTLSFILGKVWDDGNNRDGIRPASVTYEIFSAYIDNQGNMHMPGDEVVLTQSSLGDDPNHWSKMIELPKYANGEELVYVAREQVPAGYTPDQDQIAMVPSYDPESDTMGEEQYFTNTHEPEVYDTIDVTKVWDDDSNRDGLREKIRIGLYADNEYVKLVAIDNIKDNETTASFTTSSSRPLYKYKNGEEITYSVKEVAASTGEALKDYEVTYEGSAKDGFIITNTHEPATSSLTVIKEWDDNDNQDGFRPDAVQVTLTSDADPSLDADVGLSAANGWTYTWDNLPMYSGGELVKYTVTEVQEDAWVDHYIVDEFSADDLTLDTGYDAIITNIHEPETLTIEIDKLWDDKGNQDGKRPASGATVTLLADGVAVEQGNFTGVEDNEELTFAGLPVYANGKKIAYSVVEQAIEGYTTDIEARPMYVDPGEDEQAGTEDDFNKQVFAVTNSYEPEKTTISVVKAWDDNNDQDGWRPESITFNLKGIVDDGLETRDVYDASNQTLSEANGWMTTFDVPVKDQGFSIEYSVEETWLNYEDGASLPVDENNEVHGTDAGDLLYTVSYANLADSGYFTITNKHVPEVGLIGINKVWDDQDNLDGSRPSSVTFDILGLYADLDAPQTIASRTEFTLYDSSAAFENTWSGAIELPKYKDGYEIYYRATERAIPGYEPQGDIAEDGGIELKYFDGHDPSTVNEVVNKHVPELIEISGNKIWNDENNQDGVRPETVTINLYADGELIQSQDISAQNAVEGNENRWAYSFANLPKYHNGTPIRYNVSESPVDNYTLTINGYDLVNTYTPGKTFTTVIKLWDDDRDRDGIRPDNGIVRLLANGEEVNRASVALANGWFAVWTDLPVNGNGAPVEYSVTEDPVEGYTTEVTGDVKSGFTVKNTHVVETTEVSVNKVWEDDDNKAGLRPSNITVHLLVNGTIVTSKVLTAEEGWKATFTDLPKYSSGEAVTYTVAEENVPGYVATISGTTITNKLVSQQSADSGSTTPSGANSPASNSGTTPATSSGTTIAGKGAATGDHAPVVPLTVVTFSALAALWWSRRNLHVVGKHTASGRGRHTR